MVSFEDLKRVYLFENLPDSMLGKMLPFIQLHLFGERAVIFKEGQEAEDFYILLKGKMLLEVEVSETINISVGSIKPGYSFGWSALFPGSSYTSCAICVEPCEVISIPGDRFLDLLEGDTAMGYRVMAGIVNIFKSRFDRRTTQFLDAIRAHPDIQKLFSTKNES